MTFSDVDSPILSLCSGGGGLDLGIRLALPSARTVGYVEIEAYACAVLVARMEAGDLDAAPLWTDLRTFPSELYCGGVAGLIGGYPCQPFSVAGKRRGADDPRHLWPTIRNVVEHVQPQWCFFENVSGHLRLGFREVAGDLQSLGYRVAATLVTAEEVGAPHRRERLFILANTNRDGREGSSLHLLTREQGEAVPDATGASTNVADTSCLELRSEPSARPGLVGDCSPDVADAECKRLERASRKRLSSTWWTPRSSTLISWWTTEPDVGRVAHGVAVRVDRDRLRLLGNGVVPQQAAYAFRLLVNQL